MDINPCPKMKTLQSWGVASAPASVHTMAFIVFAAKGEKWLNEHMHPYSLFWGVF